MNIKQLQGRFLSWFSRSRLLTAVSALSAQAATLAPKLRNQLATLADNVSVGMVVVSFNTTNGLQGSHLNILRAVGVTGGQTFPNLGMVAQPMTAGQVRALAENPAVRSIWSNDRLVLLHEPGARADAASTNCRPTAAFTLRNGGMPVSGAGDFSVLVIDSGIDATHADLPFGTKVDPERAPGRWRRARSKALRRTSRSKTSRTPTRRSATARTARASSADTAFVRAALTRASRRARRLIGAGLGAGILVVNALGAWEWALANQYRYNIRVVSNSYGPSAAANSIPTIRSRSPAEWRTSAI